MFCLNQSLATPSSNLALDEALLESAERGDLKYEVLRLWRTEQAFVVVGRSGRVQQEVDMHRARSDSLPVLRRTSGGGAVVAASGCLFYSLLLSLEQRPELRMLDSMHRFVMTQLVEALLPLEPRIEFRGTSDLSIERRKVSGNSLRVRRNWALYHGTLLLGMDLRLIERYLRYPPREPEYRMGRDHLEFVTNLNLQEGAVAMQLQQQFGASQPMTEVPMELMEQFQREKYDDDAWNLQR